jgi:hypothetical protein
LRRRSNVTLGFLDFIRDQSIANILRKLDASSRIKEDDDQMQENNSVCSIYADIRLTGYRKRSRKPQKIKKNEEPEYFVWLGR